MVDGFYMSCASTARIVLNKVPLVAGWSLQPSSLLSRLRVSGVIPWNLKQAQRSGAAATRIPSPSTKRTLSPQLLSRVP